MANDIAPGFIKIKYTGATLTHFQILPVVPSGTLTPGNLPTVVQKNSTNVTMNIAIDAYIAILKAEVPNTVTFVEAELWSKPTPASNPIWIYTHPLGVVGTNATATDQLKQRVMSYRTSLGGGGFNYLLQIPTNVAVNARQNFPSSNTPANNTMAWLMGATSVVVGRDGGYPVVGNWYTTKYNDAARKKVLDL